MSREQKQAWFILVVFLVTVACFLGLIPLVGVKLAWGILGLFGFAGLAPLVFRKKGDPGEVDIDERDRMILRTATRAGAMSSYAAFILACMLTWGVYCSQGKETISIHVLPIIVGIGGMVFFVATSASILVLYGREGKCGDE